MKKWILFSLLAMLLLLGGIYLFIPRQLVIGKVLYVPAGQRTAYRCLTDEGLVARWLGNGTKAAGAPGYRSGRSAYSIKGGMLNVVGVLISHGEHRLNSAIQIIPVGRDSSALDWKTELHTGNNPFQKIARYRDALAVKGEMNAVLERLGRFMSREDNIYGLPIKRSLVTDTLLITTRMSGSRYPAPADYYALIQKLQQYAQAQGAQQTDFPMLHVTEGTGGRFETMVALPVNRRLPDGAGIQTKQMVPGNILIAEVKGGVDKINRGFRQVEAYISEQALEVPAISFQALVTDRLQQPDSGQWVTRLCFPIY